MDANSSSTEGSSVFLTQYEFEIEQPSGATTRRVEARDREGELHGNEDCLIFEME